MTILIVDDNKDILTLVKTILEIENFHTEVTDNGADALKLCETKEYSLIFLDLMMDGIDGYTVINELRQQKEYTETPIIALTAKAFQKDKETVLKNGFTDHLSKPFRTNDILNFARKFITS